MTRTRNILQLHLTLLLTVLTVFTGAVAQAPGKQRIVQTIQFRQIAAGIEHGQVSAGYKSTDEATGPWFINLLRVDLAKADVSVVRALDAGIGMETVNSLVARHQATAGVNGGYFRTTGTYRGESLGFLLVNGKLLSEPHNNRVEVGLINTPINTQVVFGHLKFRGELLIRRSTRDVNGVNRPIGANELLIFTPEFHTTTLTNPATFEVVVIGNFITAVNDRGSTAIPRNGFVVAARGDARDWLKNHARIGTPAKFSWTITSIRTVDDSKWKRAYSIIGGGPQLISAGNVVNTRAQEKITEAFANEHHPRTALAQLASGRLLLVTVDGRQPNVSVGMSLHTLADLLLELGAVEAINLDGGGSTTMMVEGKIVNRPSDATGERPVSDAILVFPKKNR